MSSFVLVTSQRTTLAARASLAAPLVFEPFLAQPGDGDSKGVWWVMESESDASLAYELKLSWAFGGDTSGKVRVAVGQGCRICFPGRSFTVEAANLTILANPISVRAAKVAAPFPTQNVWTQAQAMGGGGSTSFDVPPMARAVRLEVGDPAAKAASSIEIFDAASSGAFASAHYALLEQPDSGILLGSARFVFVYVPAGTWYRLVWTLNL